MVVSAHRWPIKSTRVRCELLDGLLNYYHRVAADRGLDRVLGHDAVADGLV